MGETRDWWVYPADTNNTIPMPGMPTLTPPSHQGWLCPRCQKVNAPWVAACTCPSTVTTIQVY